MSKNLSIELEQEDDGRWIADIVEIPGVSVYGASQEEAILNAQALTLQVVADRLEHGEVESADSASPDTFNFAQPTARPNASTD